MIKYPKIKRWGDDEVLCLKEYPNDLLVIEEKVDGGNGSFFVSDDGQLHFCSRNRDLTSEEDEKTFSHYRNWLVDTLNKAAERGEKPNTAYVYYVEWMAPHTIKYGAGMIPVIGLDIRVRETMEGEPGAFISRDAKEKEFARLDIPVIKLIGTIPTSEMMKKEDLESMIPKSSYYDGKAEGIVLKNYERVMSLPGSRHQVFAKIVCQQFKEQNKATFGGMKKMETETDKLILEFFTDGRIEKCLNKLINEQGLKLERALMSKLPTMVINDVLEEEFKGIYKNYRYIDFKAVKQRVPRICLRIIDEKLNQKMRE